VNKVNKNTRAGQGGKLISCPHCKDTRLVYHFSWSAILCRQCNKEVDKCDWLIAKVDKKVIKNKKIVLPSDIYQIWEFTVDVKLNKEPHYKYCSNPEGKEKCTDYHAADYICFASFVIDEMALSESVTEIRNTDKYVIQRIVMEVAIDFDPDSKISIVNLNSHPWLKTPEDRIRLAIDTEQMWEDFDVFKMIAETHRKIM
jgi:ribosomal protein S27E